jgi:hypothetical protein
MGPHPEDFNNLLFLKNLIDESMLNVDSSRIGTREIADKFLE